MRRAGFVAAVLLAACPKPSDDVDPKVRADGHYLSGQAAYLKGDFVEAHQQFAEVRALNPSDPRLAAAEGEVYLSEGKVPEAIEVFEAAAQAQPNRGTTWSRLGYLYSVKGEKEKARKALKKALAANPKDFNALETLADLQLGEGQVDEAVKNLRLASESAPEASRGELVLRLTAELQKAGRSNEAIEVLEGAVKKGLQSAPVFGELGDRLVGSTRLEEAVTAYTQAARLDAKDPAWWELVGEVQLKLGKVSEAEAAFRSSLTIKERGVVHVAIARLCQQKKNDACAQAELQKALDTATGEELRETMELAELLVGFGRRRDGLKLMRSVSEESEQKGNIELHLRTARLAKELKDEVTMRAACARALAGGRAGLKCP